MVGRFVYLALAWNPDRAVPDMATVLTHPEVGRYHAGWGRPGDVMVIAGVGGGPVGSAFARRFTRLEPGHGFVDEAVPEIGVAVEPEPRGRGIGTRLLDRLHHELRTAGLRAVSLSVELTNPAIPLYRGLGYERLHQGRRGRDHGAGTLSQASFTEAIRSWMAALASANSIRVLSS